MFASTDSSSSLANWQNTVQVKAYANTETAPEPRTPLQARNGKLFRGGSNTALVMTPTSIPEGMQFMTMFDCKYYGHSYVVHNASKHISGQQCVALVKQAISENNRKHSGVLMRITDQGLSFNNKLREDVDMEFSVEELRRIVPGTLKSKSGKLLRVALIVERHPGSDGRTRFHVVQFKNCQDLGFVADATKRMWRDHMFQNLLDVSTEEGQNAFDSFSIEQDIEEANKRCSALVRDEVFSFEKALEGIIN